MERGIFGTACLGTARSAEDVALGRRIGNEGFVGETYNQRGPADRVVVERGKRNHVGTSGRARGLSRTWTALFFLKVCRNWLGSFMLNKARTGDGG